MVPDPPGRVLYTVLDMGLGHATRMIPVILVTALNDTEAKIEGIKAGADDFITKPPNKMELIARTNSLINLKKLNNSLTNFENVLLSLAQAVEAGFLNPRSLPR